MYLHSLVLRLRGMSVDAIRAALEDEGDGGAEGGRMAHIRQGRVNRRNYRNRHRTECFKVETQAFDLSY